MAVTLTTLISQVRAIINESSARFWSDADITIWLNEAQRDVARKTESIQDLSTSVAAVVGTDRYALPASVIRVHRVEFQPTSQTQIYTVEARTDQELDQVFGTNRLQQGSFPEFFSLWGMPGGTGTQALKMRVFPVPAQTGTFSIYYYGVPPPMTTGSSTATIPEGWEDLLVNYAESEARRKDRDATWQDSRAIYDAKVKSMVEVTRQLHDQAGVVSVGGRNVPGWLYEGDW